MKLRIILRLLVVTVFLYSFASALMAESVEIAGVVYENVDPEETDFKEVDHPIEDWQYPATEEQRKDGFVIYSRPEPFDIRPWSVPRKGEALQSLSISAAASEITASWFAIYALKDLVGVDIEVIPALKDGTLSSDEYPQIDVFYVHYWPQRTDWKGRTYYIIPELILPFEDGRIQYPLPGGTLSWKEFNIKTGKSQLFWLVIRMPKDIPISTKEFDFKLRIRIGDGVFDLPLKVRMLPFALKKPTDKCWLLYGDLGNWWTNQTDEIRKAVLKDMAEHGIDGIVRAPFGRLDLSKIAEGKVIYDPSELVHFHRLAKEVGMRGPYIIGEWVEKKAASALGLKVDLYKEWPDELTDAVKLVARKVVDTLEKYNIRWYFYQFDEPDASNLYALQQYKCWYEAGARTYVTFYKPETYTAAGKWMTAPALSIILITTKSDLEMVHKKCKENNQLFFWYGSGCYLGEEGRIFANRALTGVYFWKTKADAEVSWTYCRPHEDPFNDFDGMKVNRREPKDQCTVYPQLERPNDRTSFIRPILTIQWEAIREGVNDYCYLYTLKEAIGELEGLVEGANGDKSKDLKELIDKARSLLTDITERKIPWKSEFKKRGYDNKDLIDIRRTVATQLEEIYNTINLLKNND